MNKILMITLMLGNINLAYGQGFCPYDSIVYNGVVYHTVRFGTQCWLDKNLNTGIMIDGTLDQTNNSIIEKYCLGNDTFYCTTYGGLYQWDELMNYSTINGVQGICPAGLHIPTDAEWYTLEHFVDSTINNPNALGSRGTTAGFTLQMQCDTCFNLLLGGQNIGYQFLNGGNGFFWSSTEIPNSGNCIINPPNCYVYYRRFDAGIGWIFRFDNSGWSFRPKAVGMSVRCICDSVLLNSVPGEGNKAQNITISPNPFNTTTEINFDKIYRVIDLALYDPQGKMILRRKYFNSAKIVLDRSVIENGFYFLRELLLITNPL